MSTLVNTSDLPCSLMWEYIRVSSIYWVLSSLLFVVNAVESAINNLWLTMQRWMPFPANSKLFCHKPSSGGITSIFIGRQHSHPHWQGVKTCKIFSAQKLRVYISRTRSSSNEFIGYNNNNIIFHLYSAHIHYLSEALYKIISKTTIIKFRNKFKN